MHDKSHREIDAADLGEHRLSFDVYPEDLTAGLSDDDLLGYTRDEINAGEEPVGNMERRATRLRCAGVHMERVLIHPTIFHGRPVILGTCIPITQIVSSLGEGMSLEDAERKYGVTTEDIRAALRFLAEFGRRSF
jgi:uncharacterized protein (DUF433 family)